MIADMDFDLNHKVSFVEFCCAYFGKPYSELNNFVDEEARQAALAEAKLAAEKVALVEEKQRLAREEEERKERQKQEEIEAEKRLVSLLAMLSCMFDLFTFNNYRPVWREKLPSSDVKQKERWILPNRMSSELVLLSIS